jgi:ankyrin repeat protein
MSEIETTRAQRQAAIATLLAGARASGLARVLFAAERALEGELFGAASAGDLELVETLMHVADVHATDDWGRTPLMLAAEHGHAECVRALLRATNPRAIDSQARTALMLATHAGKLDCMRALLPWSDPDARDESGATALLHAAYGVYLINDHPGRLDCFRELLPATTDLAIDAWLAQLEDATGPRPMAQALAAERARRERSALRAAMEPAHPIRGETADPTASLRRRL